MVVALKNKKQNELHECFSSRGMSKICNYPCVWICATLSPDSLSLPSRLKLSVVGKWVKCCSGLHEESLVSLDQMNHFSPIWCTYLRIQAKSLKSSVQWSRVEFGLRVNLLCWINSEGNLPTLDGRAFYQCVLPQGFRLYKIQLDTLKKMDSHGGTRVEVREPWLNLLKSFFFSLLYFFFLFLSCYCLVFPSPTYQCNMSGSTLLCLLC